MKHSAKILAHSISPAGVEITSMEVVLPRIVLAEFNTHRAFSRNSASSRAIPIEKMIRMVMENPYIPISWGKNQKGMQAEQDVDEATASSAEYGWLRARDDAVKSANLLLDLGIHKQLTNRLLEPFMWHTIIVTSTEWANFDHLRNQNMAHPDIHRTAALMQGAREASTPVELEYGEWHLPLVFADEMVPVSDGPDDVANAWSTLVKISAGRCARISYLTHDGKRDQKADIALHDRLLEAGHMSPFEHQATPLRQNEWDGHRDRFSGNFRMWKQYRKTIPGEEDIMGRQ